MTNTLGLITGNGYLPELVLREAKQHGLRIALCAIRGETSHELERWADACCWIKVGQLGRVIDFFKKENVSKAIMAGKITKTNLFKGDVQPDLEMIKALRKIRNHSDDSLLGAVADHLDQKGIRILSSTSYLTEGSLPKKGVLSKRKPSKKELEDIEFGWNLAKKMGSLDVGQTVVVKNCSALAVEAIEGTDEAILRGGRLGSADVVVVKVAKPSQDMRFDVPTIGLKTLDALIAAQASVLAFEAEKTILLQRQEFTQKANQNHLCIVAYENK